MSCGATVCPIDGRTLLFPQAVVRFLREEAITVLYAVPSALIALLNHSTWRGWGCRRSGSCSTPARSSLRPGCGA